MTSIDFVDDTRHARGVPDWLRSVGCGSLYWLLFLLALEPGNVLHAKSMGHALDVDSEVLRICAAALLGGSATPLIVGLTRRFPVSGARGWRNMMIHAAGAAAVSFVLIVISCVLAAWVLMGQILPSVAEVRSELAGNWLLLLYALGALAAIIHAVKYFPQPPGRAESPPASQPTRVPVKTRGRLGYVEVADIEWIESQGNYLALHAGGQSHLIRETLNSFSRLLDPQRFIRVHRRVIVAIDRVREIQPLANGDSNLILQDGRTLRASRSYREIVRTRWAEVMADTSRTTSSRQ